MENFKSIVRLIKTLNTEEKCIQFLVDLKWNGIPTCSGENCSNPHNNNYNVDRKIFRCSKCQKNFSVKTGTIFQGSNVPLIDWFVAIYEIANSKRGISSVALSEKIDVSYKTALSMSHKIKEALDDENEGTLFGIVEIDETFAGAKLNRDKKLAYKIYKRNLERIHWGLEGKKEKENRLKREAKYAKKTGKPSTQKESKLEELLKDVPAYNRPLIEDKYTRNLHHQKIHYKKNIVGLIERDIYNSDGVLVKQGKLLLKKMGRHKADINGINMMPLLKKHIDKSAKIMTDGHPAYNDVKNHFRKHDVIIHSREKGDYTPILYSEGEGNDMKTTNHIENIWCHFKKMENGTYFHFSYRHTDKYLNEFAFRYNNRSLTNSQRFSKLLGKCLKKNITNEEIRGTIDSYSYMAA
ncbi:MAG: IS1595 family transposase [Flavobacteriales bacterium]|nr:IS1595 family transposase [Flavobacteriales bacterium]